MAANNGSYELLWAATYSFWDNGVQLQFLQSPGRQQVAGSGDTCGAGQTDR